MGSEKRVDGGGGYKCEVMEREAVTGRVHATPSLPVVLPSLVFTHLSTIIEEREWGMCEDGSYQRGLSHCVEVTPLRTYWPLQWTTNVFLSPTLKVKWSQ